MRRKTGIAFTLPVPSQFLLLNLALLVLGSVATRAGSRDNVPKSARPAGPAPSGKADTNVAPALNRTPKAIERRSVKPPDLEGYTGYWILDESKRDTLSSRSPAGDGKYQLDTAAERTGPHTYVGSLKLRDAFLRQRPGQSGADPIPIPFTYEAVGTVACDDPPSVVPNGTNWDVSLRITLKETCSVSWSDAAVAIATRLGSLPPLRAEGGRPRHVNCWAAVTTSEKDRMRAPSADNLACTSPTRFSAADGKPWSKSVPVRFPLIPETRATTPERFILILDVATPATGPRGQPVFAAPGANSITLSVQVGDKVITKTYPVVGVSPAGYAGVGGMARCPMDLHGCPACPHNVVGPITTGSAQVTVGGRPAARVGDKGTHAACCGPGIFEIIAGDPEVIIDGQPAAKVGSPTKHGGGAGTIIRAGP